MPAPFHGSHHMERLHHGPADVNGPLQPHHSSQSLAQLHSQHQRTVGELQHPHADPPMSPFLAIVLLYGTLFLMLGAQTALFLWKRKHQHSYDLVTLIGLWLMPAIFSLQLKFWRFIMVWLVYTVVTVYLLHMAMKRKLESTTPRKVYAWFLGVYKISKFIGVAGYILLLCEMLGLGLVMRKFIPKDLAIDLVWYGVYFGVLGRDCAEVASDRMASTMGTGRKLVAQVNNCGVCGTELKDYSHLGEENTAEEVAVQLSCKHCFHDLCIRGWTMVGKKDTCPVCLEKVDLRNLYADRPWETRNLTWIQMLDGVRYLVVWNPLIFMVLSVLYHLFAPHHAHGHHTHTAHNITVPGAHVLPPRDMMSPPALLLGHGSGHAATA
eukprot:CAMPEP_0202897870 /NCGR_PEP_ID=MMETSP1392-20130828/6528_1 /ASSEMBLY_ACC=CAM_ASM_000868 /TAXON_ID=225041 /ORGANISM="Chlamydomonas chlamydogama, Strain SAG 11-48b" /LENGTH=379 /DNA_ID=CAMNT_0049583633 /DNA_START=134 /DNA_END=1273 /DNA_ORIENTATION=-